MFASWIDLTLARLWRASALALIVGLAATACAAPVMAQAKPTKKREADRKQDAAKAAADERARKQDADRELKRRLAAGQTHPAAEPAAGQTAAAKQEPRPAATIAPNLFDLWFLGGPLMYPITFISFLVVLFACERALALRRRKVVPPRFVRALGQLAAKPGVLDLRQTYALCQQSRSAAAHVLRAVLMKAGRPLSELEHTLTETSEREAAKLYKNVRPINLATTIAPLLGLLGTVQGMIECFFITAHLPVGADKSENLANGIYIALVTTFGGLVVAIPASVIAHYFEGRIQALFRDIDELVQALMPQLERFEGKLRPVIVADKTSGAPTLMLERIGPPAAGGASAGGSSAASGAPPVLTPHRA
ncbi:MAG TPA: MotA/TolQ/ExbB proton channel family protein [Pirellulales bacterium]